jgi:hypothetical protein
LATTFRFATLSWWLFVVALFSVVVSSGFFGGSGRGNPWCLVPSLCLVRAPTGVLIDRSTIAFDVGVFFWGGLSSTTSDSFFCFFPFLVSIRSGFDVYSEPRFVGFLELVSGSAS